MQKLDGTTIKLNRGDVLKIALSIKLEDESNYTFQIGDRIIFSVYNKGKMSEEPVLTKEITIAEETQNAIINISNTETKIGELINKPVEYWYEVELNDQYTVIGYDEDGAKQLILYPEGSRDNE